MAKVTIIGILLALISAWCRPRKRLLTSNKPTPFRAFSLLAMSREASEFLFSRCYDTQSPLGDSMSNFIASKQQQHMLFYPNRRVAALISVHRRFSFAWSINLDLRSVYLCSTLEFHSRASFAEETTDWITHSSATGEEWRVAIAGCKLTHQHIPFFPSL